jgi:hypothetical protein
MNNPNFRSLQKAAQKTAFAAPLDMLVTIRLAQTLSVSLHNVEREPPKFLRHDSMLRFKLMKDAIDKFVSVFSASLSQDQSVLDEVAGGEDFFYILFAQTKYLPTQLRKEFIADFLTLSEAYNKLILESEETRGSISNT